MKRLSGHLLCLLLALGGVSCSGAQSPPAEEATTAPPVIDAGPAESPLAANGESLEGHDAKPLVISMSGDIMMGTTYPAPMLPANDGRDIFRDAKPFIREADLAVGNLEGAMIDGGESAKAPGKYSYSFRMPTRYGSHLSDAGYDFLSMANNHANDFGVEGVISTERVLDREGIRYAGIRGRTESVLLEKDGVRYGLCAFGHNIYTLRHQDLESAGRIIRDLRDRADIVIVSMHGGAEGRDKRRVPYGTEMFLNENRGDLRAFTHFCIDNGADVVYGHGPHIVRAVELYKGRFIAYSLGNFCTPYGINVSGVCGYAPVVTVRVLPDGRFVDGRIHPFIQQYGKGPKKDEKGIVTRHMKALSDTDVPESEAIVLPDGAIRKK